ncbi:MAG: mycofactocin-coupled SDR family oxidoreductase [Bacteroidota bacterium]
MKEPKNRPAKATSRRDMLKSSVLAGGALATVPFSEKYQSQEKPFQGEVAFITGGARGIGRATALKFAEQGVNVALLDIATQIESVVHYPMATVEDLAETQRMVEEKGVACLSFQADVRDKEQVQGAVSHIVKTWGRLDFLVANAAIATISPLENMSMEAWKDVLDVNLTGPALCIQAVIPQMKKQKSGRIVCISSVNGRRGSASVPSYTASKWGLIGLTKCVALEVGKSNITANAICPTGVNTDMFNNEWMRKATDPSNPVDEALHELLKEEHALPVGMLEPGDIADSILFFCGPQAKHITGVVLDVAAGMTAKNSA